MALGRNRRGFPVDFQEVGWIPLRTDFALAAHCFADPFDRRKEDPMSKTIVVVGFGPGISTAVAEKFGAEGYNAALVGRTPARLEAGVAALKAKGVAAGAYAGDAADPRAIRVAIERAGADLGPIGALHWNAYDAGQNADLTSVDPAKLSGAFDVSVVGLLAAVQAALADLKAAKDGSVLVTNGAFGLANPMIDQMVVMLKTIEVPLANAAKHKLVGMLAERLRGEGVFVGEVMVAGAVKGTQWAGGADGIDPVRIAEAFWRLHKDRSDIRAQIS